MQEHFAIIKEPHCRGFSMGKRQKVFEWVGDQGLDVYNRMNDLLLGVIGLKNRRGAGPLDLKHQHLFYLACYDLDRFKTDVLEKGLLEKHGGTPDMKTVAASDDAALLKLAIQWIKGVLDGI